MGCDKGVPHKLKLLSYSLQDMQQARIGTLVCCANRSNGKLYRRRAQYPVQKLSIISCPKIEHNFLSAHPAGSLKVLVYSRLCTDSFDSDLGFGFSSRWFNLSKETYLQIAHAEVIGMVDEGGPLFRKVALLVHRVSKLHAGKGLWDLYGTSQVMSRTLPYSNLRVPPG